MRTVFPRARWSGEDPARRMGAVFAENVRDLYDKAERGSGRFPAGFLHTSTTEHEGTCYYDQMWSRDCGRGVIELARLGFADEAERICDYFLSHITFGDHWSREIHTAADAMNDELDGNALILLALVNTWRMGGEKEEIGKRFASGAAPVLRWAVSSVERSAHCGLLISRSELSGNPDTAYGVYGLYGNYAMYLALSSFAHMLKSVGAGWGDAMRAAERIGRGLQTLISDGRSSRAPAGCWITGIDSRDGSAYDVMEFAGVVAEAWHWTRQLPFILNPDADRYGSFPQWRETDAQSYDLVKRYMAQSRYFRRYGFVSNTGWTGIGGRHDDTMCGYGQGFFTQSALLADDVNCYGKCLEGVARLAYDGNVLTPLTHENDPFVLHECFDYAAYEEALDHTFGTSRVEGTKIADNPGDEGNLVQAAEVVKALRLAIGAEYDGNGDLRLTPRLPWLWDRLEVRDYPVLTRNGRPGRISFTYENERWTRSSVVTITEGADEFDNIFVRFGPYPAYARGSGALPHRGATWRERRVVGAEARYRLDEE